MQCAPELEYKVPGSLTVHASDTKILLASKEASC